MSGTRYDLQVTPGQRYDRVFYWQVAGSGARLPLDGWTPVMVIEQDNTPLYSSSGPEPDFSVLASTTEVGRIDLFMGFEFTGRFYRPLDSQPDLHYYLELVDDTLNTNTIPLLWGLVPIGSRYDA